jgi:hypothetical protein
MAPTIKKYFIYIIFLVSPIAINAQNKTGKTTVCPDSSCKAMAFSNNQNNDTAGVSISKLDHSNQPIVGLSTPEDSLIIATGDKNVSTECNENLILSATYSVLAKDIIENYKYDFSETFIDILFFENIDLARTRTI